MSENCILFYFVGLSIYFFYGTRFSTGSLAPTEVANKEKVIPQPEKIALPPIVVTQDDYEYSTDF